MTLLELVKHVGRRFGVEISRYRPVEARRAERLRRLGIAVVLDVGANAGQYAEQLRRAGYSGRIVSFEPLETAYRDLERTAAADPLWECYRIALGDRDDRLRLNVASNLASSSLLPMTEEMHRYARPAGVEVVPVKTLDSLELPLDGPTLLKLDVQGYEAHILDGSAATLAHEHLVLIECELTLSALYHGQASLSDIVDRLDRLGFEMIDLDPFFYDPVDGRVLSIDATFARRDAATG